ncbi:linker for activation of T-cells family member 2 isoform 7-T9 [Hipposideros larvatus]
MGAETELLWPGAALLLLLGVVASLCVRCSRPGAKRSEKIYEQRNLDENQQSFTVARTYSLAGHAWPGASMDTASDMASARKDKLLQFSPSLEDSASPRYQNFRRGSRHGSDAAYIYPIPMDYYNWGQFRKPKEDDDDANSYENVLICKQELPESEPVQRKAPSSPARSPDEDDDGEPDYVNGDVPATEC